MSALSFDAEANLSQSVCCAMEMSQFVQGPAALSVAYDGQTHNALSQLQLCRLPAF
jgi:hypothetical protein